MVKQKEIDRLKREFTIKEGALIQMFDDDKKETKTCIVSKLIHARVVESKGELYFKQSVMCFVGDVNERKVILTTTTAAFTRRRQLRELNGFVFRVKLTTGHYALYASVIG